MKLRILGFDWDDTNTSKLEMHNLDPGDVEDLFECGDYVMMDHPKHRERKIALGSILDGRFVMVIFEYEVATRWVRVVTAYEPTNNRWWKIYAEAKGIKS